MKNMVLNFVATILFAAPALADTLHVRFAGPLTEEALSRLVERTDVQPVALESQHGSLTEGYELRAGETLAMALQNFRTQREAFLVDITQSIRNAMDADETMRLDTDAAALVQSFEQLVAEKHNVSLSGIRIRGDDNAARLFRESEVLTITPSRQRFDEVDLRGDAPRGRIESLSKAWGPTGGQAELSRHAATQIFYFSKISFDAKATFAAESLVSNSQYANYAGYWATNLPYAYVEAPIGDSASGDSFRIGTAKAAALRKLTSYYVYMSLYPQSAASATVTIRGLKGVRKPQNCFLVWCVKQETASKVTSFTAPGAVRWK